MDHKQRLQEKIRELRYSTETGVIIQEGSLLHDLLKLHPQHKNHNALYFTVAIDSQYQTNHFLFCDRDTQHIIGIESAVTSSRSDPSVLVRPPTLGGF